MEPEGIHASDRHKEEETPGRPPLPLDASAGNVSGNQNEDTTAGGNGDEGNAERPNLPVASAQAVSGSLSDEEGNSHVPVVSAALIPEDSHQQAINDNNNDSTRNNQNSGRDNAADTTARTGHLDNESESSKRTPGLRGRRHTGTSNNPTPEALAAAAVAPVVAKHGLAGRNPNISTPRSSDPPDGEISSPPPAVEEEITAGPLSEAEGPVVPDIRSIAEGDIVTPSLIHYKVEGVDHATEEEEKPMDPNDLEEASQNNASVAASPQALAAPSSSGLSDGTYSCSIPKRWVWICLGLLFLVLVVAAVGISLSLTGTPSSAAFDVFGLQVNATTIATTTDIDLRHSQLDGPLPSDLGLLTALTSLDLAGNELTGSIPSELGQLTALTRLSLSGNQLTDSIPSELGQLNKLTYLALNGNQLTGEIPSELGRLTALTRAFLWDNRLTGSIPADICAVESLIFLRVDCETNPFPLDCSCGAKCICL